MDTFFLAIGMILVAGILPLVISRYAELHPPGLKIKSHSGQAVSHIADRKIIILSNRPLLSFPENLLYYPKSNLE